MRNSKTRSDPELLPEFDFSTSRPNKYAKHYARAKNLVILAPDVLPYFPDSESVNKALRALVKLARKRVKKTAG